MIGQRQVLILPFPTPQDPWSLKQIPPGLVGVGAQIPYPVKEVGKFLCFLWVQALLGCPYALAVGMGVVSGGLGSSLAGTRRCGEGYSGTTVRIQVQDGVGG